MSFDVDVEEDVMFFLNDAVNSGLVGVDNEFLMLHLDLVVVVVLKKKQKKEKGTINLLIKETMFLRTDTKSRFIII